MLIRKVGYNVYDVFGNKGFDCWTRLKKYFWGFKVVATNVPPPTRETMREIATAIHNNPNGSIENV